MTLTFTTCESEIAVNGQTSDGKRPTSENPCLPAGNMVYMLLLGFSRSSSGKGANVIATSALVVVFVACIAELQLQLNCSSSGDKPKGRPT